MSKYTFTNGFLTGAEVSTTLSGLPPHQYTFTNGILTGVAPAPMGVTPIPKKMSFTNGILAGLSMGGVISTSGSGDTIPFLPPPPNVNVSISDWSGSSSSGCAIQTKIYRYATSASLSTIPLDGVIPPYIFSFKAARRGFNFSDYYIVRTNYITNVENSIKIDAPDASLNTPNPFVIFFPISQDTGMYICESHNPITLGLSTIKFFFLDWANGTSVLYNSYVYLKKYGDGHNPGDFYLLHCVLGSVFYNNSLRIVLQFVGGEQITNWNTHYDFLIYDILKNTISFINGDFFIPSYPPTSSPLLRTYNASDNSADLGNGIMATTLLPNKQQQNSNDGNFVCFIDTENYSMEKYPLPYLMHNPPQSGDFYLIDGSLEFNDNAVFLMHPYIPNNSLYCFGGYQTYSGSSFILENKIFNISYHGEMNELTEIENKFYSISEFLYSKKNMVVSATSGSSLPYDIILYDVIKNKEIFRLPLLYAYSRYDFFESIDDADDGIVYVDSSTIPLQNSLKKIFFDGSTTTLMSNFIYPLPAYSILRLLQNILEIFPGLSGTILNIFYLQ
jgi:hypothetical protein